MNVVIPYLADLILKQLGPVGPESLSLTAFIKLHWRKYADAYLADFFRQAFNLETGEVYKGAVPGLFLRHTLTMEGEFIDNVLAGDFDLYLEKSYEVGVKFIGVIKKQDSEEELLEAVVRLTGSKLPNVKRTIRRWFEETQGKYFDRFIKGETNRLFFAAEAAEGKEALKKLGANYKKFVEADGYWSSIGGFDTNTAKVMGQVESLHQQGIQGYKIQLNYSEGTCPVCEHLDGSEWQTAEAVGEIDDLVWIGAASDPKLFNPWPDRGIVENYPDPQDSPYRLPPFHLNCNCDVVPT